MRTGEGDPARTLALLVAAGRGRPPRPTAEAERRRGGGRRDRAGRRGRARGGEHAGGGRAARRVGDDALHVRAGQGRAARPHGRRAVAGDAAGGRPHRAVGGRRQPGALRGASVGRARDDGAAAARPGPARQVRARAGRVRRARALRRRHGRRAHPGARVRAGIAAQEPATTPDAEWWESAGPLLAEVVDPERYPLASRVGTAAGEAQGGAYDAERAYRFGLERIIEGLEP